MAITVHGVTNAIILEELPASMAKYINATSANINTGMIDRWIEDAAAIFNSILTGKGIDADSLDENSTRVIRYGVVNYVVGKILQKSDYSQEQISFRFTEYSAAKEEIKSKPELVMGESQSSDSKIASNIDTTVDVDYTYSEYKF